MRVLLSVHHLPVRNAGAAGVTLRLTSELSGLGHTADLLSMADMGITQESVLAHMRYPWFVSSRLREVEKNYDVLDLSSGDGWLYERRRGNSGPLVVVRSHGLEHIGHESRLEAARRGELHLSWKYPLYHGGFRLWEVAESFRRADLAFFLNREEQSYAVDHLRVQRNRTRIIDNGIADRFLDLPLPVRTRSGGLRIVLVGSFTHRKVHQVPEALNALLNRHSDWEVGFLGTGTEEETVRAAFSREVQDRVTVMRSYDNDSLPALLREYDVLLFPSLSEGFGIAAFEGMACGLALVASALAPLTERLEDGREALFVPPGDIAAIEEALERLAANRDLLETLQREGHRRAQDFSWSRIAKATAGFYEEGLKYRKATAVE